MMERSNDENYFVLFIWIRLDCTKISKRCIVEKSNDENCFS